MAHRIATSPLVKTAIFGRDANWGRIVCAVGNSQTPILDASKVSLTLRVGVPDPAAGGRPSSSPTPEGESLLLFRRGTPHDTNEQVAARILAGTEITLDVDLGEGDAKSDAVLHDAKLWTCDFSHEYVSINADYRS